MLDQLVTRPLSCPVCDNAFTLYSPKVSSPQLLKRDADFCPYYQGINPLFFQIWVCPNCGYASYKEHWEELSSREKTQISEQGEQSKEGLRFDFARPDRNLFAAILSYQLAFRCYSKRRIANAFLLGNIQLRLAWLCRYGHDLKRERIHLETARIHFQKAYQHDAGKTSAAKLAYLIGEIHRRAGKNREAVDWFVQAKRFTDVRGEIYRLTNQQLYDAKEAIHFVEVFQQVDFLHPLEKELLSLLASNTHRRRFLPGQTICKQGEAGDSLYIVLKGAVTIHLNTPEAPPVATLGSAQFFGEMSLLTGQPRMATVMAANECECLEIAKIAFKTLLISRPEIASTISQVLADRQAQNERQPIPFETSKATEEPPHSKTGFLKRIISNYGL